MHRGKALVGYEHAQLGDKDVIWGLKSKHYYFLYLCIYPPPLPGPSAQPFLLLCGRIGRALIIISAEMIRRSNRDRMPFPSINAGGLECLSWLGLYSGLWREKRGRMEDGEEA